MLRLKDVRGLKSPEEYLIRVFFIFQNDVVVSNSDVVIWGRLAA